MLLTQTVPSSGTESRDGGTPTGGGVGDWFGIVSNLMPEQEQTQPDDTG